MCKRIVFGLLSFLSIYAAAQHVAAQDTLHPLRRHSHFHADAELDPIAYALNGYSVHIGLSYDRVRFDIGAFGIDVPGFLHGQDGFDASNNGFGFKLQYFLFSTKRGPLHGQQGLFVGVQTDLGKLVVEREHSGAAARRTQRAIAVQTGYRIHLFGQFYMTPWIAVGYEFEAPKIHIENATYESSHLQVFPTIHLGYQFR